MHKGYCLFMNIKHFTFYYADIINDKNFIIFYYRNTSQEDIDKICNGILDNLYIPDKSSECMNNLRQLYFIMHTSKTEPW